MSSCVGCRVLLRKGCGDDCIIKPCLQWIQSPDSQANATFFLSEFYGRSYLMNSISAAPRHLRPAAFRSLLYEACGRTVNPVYGAVGLLWSGNWRLCQAAVEAVMKGDSIGPNLSSEFSCDAENRNIVEVVSSKNMMSSAASHDEDESSMDSSGLESVNQSGIGGIPSLNSGMSWHPSCGSEHSGGEDDSLSLSVNTQRVFFFE